MRTLAELLRQCDVRDESQQRVAAIVIDSRSVGPDTVWFALPGAQHHGAQFLDLAPTAPIAVVTDAAGADVLARASVAVHVVPNPRAVVGPVSAWLLGYPAKSMTLVGVTGTNGKTSVTQFLGDALSALGHEAAVLGTLGLRTGRNHLDKETGFTTPEADALQRLLASVRDSGVTHVAMEVSSHALALHRADGIEFDVAVFTNLSQDHLDFHADMEDYFQAKARLFAPERCRRAVICVDDEWGLRLAREVQSHGIPYITYGSLDCDWRIVTRTNEAVAVDAAGEALDLPMVSLGDFTASNLVATAATLAMLGVPISQIPMAMAECRPVPGRMQRIAAPTPVHPQVIVDYAHSPDAVARVLRAARPMSGRLIAVLGAGGGRDRAKRPLMGEAASLADVVVVTDDNPRDEDPQDIRAAVFAGVRAAQVHDIADRQMAIDFAISLARTNDIVVILGKGAERGQQYGTEVREFDDRDVAARSLAAWGTSTC